MAQAILITDEQLTSTKLEEHINESIDIYAKSRKVMRKDINTDEIHEAVKRITQAKISDELQVSFMTDEDGTHFRIQLTEPFTTDESNQILSNGEPYVTFTEEGHYLTDGVKNDESMSAPEEVLEFLDSLLTTYLHSATFVAIASTGLRTS